jgi:hypothetical protein
MIVEQSNFEQFTPTLFVVCEYCLKNVGHLVLKCRLRNSMKALKVKYSRKATSKFGRAIFSTNYERIEDKRCETNDIIPNINLHNHEKTIIFMREN